MEMFFFNYFKLIILRRVIKADQFSVFNIIKYKQITQCILLGMVEGVFGLSSLSD